MATEHDENSVLIKPLKSIMVSEIKERKYHYHPTNKRANHFIQILEKALSILVR